jgi:hypothetical protein
MSGDGGAANRLNSGSMTPNTTGAVSPTPADEQEIG